METDSYRIVHYRITLTDEVDIVDQRITKRKIPAPETRIALSLSEINTGQHQGVSMNQGILQTIILGLAEISAI